MSPNQNHIGPITEELLSDNSLRDKTLFHPFSKLNCVSHTHRPGVLDLFCASNVSWAISNLCFKNQTAFLSARVFFLMNISKLVSAALFPWKETACPSCFQSSCLFHEHCATMTWTWVLAQRLLFKYSSMLCLLQESSLGNFGKMLSKAMFVIIKSKPLYTNWQGAQTLCYNYSASQCTSADNL